MPAPPSEFQKATSQAQHEAMLIFHVRDARQKAMPAAVAEALSLLARFRPRMAKGGPLGETRGIFWLYLEEGALPSAEDMFPLLGYTSSVQLVKFLEKPRQKAKKKPRELTWRGRPFELDYLYKEDPEEFRENAPDRRTFLLTAEDGSVREVRGYRGDSGTLSRRGLPVADARLLVNLAFVEPGGRLLDPFAGAGGVVIEALHAGQLVHSLDIDPLLARGLVHLGSNHVVGDSRHMPFEDAMFDSVATEVPFEVSATQAVADSVAEIARILKPSGRAAMMVGKSQATAVRGSALGASLLPRFEMEIDRKGLPVFVFAWQKQSDNSNPSEDGN